MRKHNEGMPSVLTIAGTDPSGGAGVLADVKTFTAFGCYGSSVITALTAQNTTGVQGVHPVPPSFVQQQISSVLDDIPIRTIKTGMLHDKEIIGVIVDEIVKRKKGWGDALPQIVLDPVMVSTSGHTLLRDDAIETLCQKLLPISTIVTPNIPEAELLRHTLTKSQYPEIKSIDEMINAAYLIKNLVKIKAGLIKGGHLMLKVSDVLAAERNNQQPGFEIIWQDQCGPMEPEILRAARSKNIEDTEDSSVVVDVLWTDHPMLFVRPRLDTKSTHGTGCTLSAAIACEIAKGAPIREAVLSATNYTHQGIATAPSIGQGNGPLNHVHPIMVRIIPRPTATCPAPFTAALIRSTRKLWKDYVQHAFVVQLGQGSLPREKFMHFIKQDYHYLKHYARAYGLLAAKSLSFASIASSAQTVLSIIEETNMHASYCETFGITHHELLTTQESAATTGYTTYILETGLRGDETTLLVALMACLLGYGEVGLWLKKWAMEPFSPIHIEGNPYRKWMDDYSGDRYQNAVQMGIGKYQARCAALEAHIAANPPSASKFEELLGVWERVVKLEIGFWDMAMSLS